jgi:predicted nucleic acid-binding protein
VGLIYLDSCLLIYLLEDHPEFAASARAAVAGAGPARLAISPLVQHECLVGPLRRGDPVLQSAYESFFQRFLRLPMTEQVFAQAAHLRARFGLKTPDALHLACAQQHRCDALWTNDERLAQAAHGLAVNLLGGALPDASA